MTTTLDPATLTGSAALSGGDLTASFTGTTGGNVRSTVFLSNAPFYFEVKLNSGTIGFSGWGIVQQSVPLGIWITQAAIPAGVWIKRDDGYYYHNGTQTGPISSGAAGNVWMVACDPIAGKLWFGRQGTWDSSGNPAAGTGPQFTGVTGQLGLIINNWGIASACVANFGDTAFAYTPPVGFGKLIPAPALALNLPMLGI
jgi:hypothetical protein